MLVTADPCATNFSAEMESSPSQSGQTLDASPSSAPYRFVIRRGSTLIELSTAASDDDCKMLTIERARDVDP